MRSNWRSPRTLLLSLSLVGLSSSAPAVTINPSDDGSVYFNGSVDTTSYLAAASTYRGVVEFPTISGPIATAFLSVNPYGLPLEDKSVSVYGYESSDGVLTGSDYNAGTLLGVLVLSDSLGYGEDAFFDVTSFLQGVGSPYVGFNLRTDSGSDVFSSLEYNYGHPAQLTVELIPEPSTGLLVMTGLLGLTYRRRNLV